MNLDIQAAWDETMRAFTGHLNYLRRKTRTVDIRLRQLRAFSQHVNVRPEDVTTVQIMDYLGSRPHWSVSTYNLELAGLRLFFAWAAGPVKRIPFNPAIDLHALPNKPAARPQTERRILLDAIETATEPTRSFLELSVFVGLKSAEIAFLRTSDIERDAQGTFRIKVNRKAEEVELLVPRQLAAKLLDRPKGYVFPGDINGHVAPATVTRYVSLSLPEKLTSEKVRGLLAPRDGGHYHSPMSTRIATSSLIDYDQVKLQLIFLDRDLESNPGGAISECKELLEQAFKAMLIERKVEFTNTDFVASLWTKVSTAYGLREVEGNSKAGGDVKLMTRQLGALVDGINAARDDMGTWGHGHLKDRGAQVRHARLVFNSTVALIEFLIDGTD